jgi:WD40 repeat protein
MSLLALGTKSNSSISQMTSGAFIVAKQLSDFSINSITFSPYESDNQTIISCGRENIRFWRIRNGHLPSRPVLLNEFCRGYIYKDIAFYEQEMNKNDGPGTDTLPKDRSLKIYSNSSTKFPQRYNFAFFASNKGLVVKVDCAKEQILCAYQLHTCEITSFAIRQCVAHAPKLPSKKALHAKSNKAQIKDQSYAVTGGSDHKLRLWPMDFSDFQVRPFTVFLLILNTSNCRWKLSMKAH